MSAVTIVCPNCSQTLRLPVSSAGKQGKCQSCGHKLSIPSERVSPSQQTLTQAAPPPTPSNMAKSSHMCNECGNDDIKSFEFVYACGIGRKTGSLAIGSVGGVVNGPLALAGAMAKGSIVNESGLASLCQPPQKRGYSTGVWILATVLWPWGIFALLFLYPNWRKYNLTVLPHEIDIWKRSRICMNCGNKWVLT